MSYYKLSEQRVRRVLNSPKRVEEGIAPKTVAMMQPASIKASAGKTGARKEEDWTHEIWVMIQEEKNRRKIISAWRYPGKTRPRDESLKDKIREVYADYLAAKEK